MYILEIDNKEFELKTNILTIKRIEQTLRKPFLRTIENFNELDTDAIIKMFMAGTTDLTVQKEIKETIENSETLGIEGFYKKLSDYIFEIQHPGKTEEEKKQIMKEAQKEMKI